MNGNFEGGNEPLKKAETIFEHLSFPECYKRYSWGNDTWQRGFPEICQLEQTLSSAAKSETISIEHLKKIARWGKLRDFERVSCNDSMRELMNLSVASPIRSMDLGQPSRANFFGLPLLRFLVSLIPNWREYSDQVHHPLNSL